MKSLIWKFKKININRQIDQKIRKIIFKRDRAFEKECKDYFAKIGFKLSNFMYSSIYYYYTQNRDVRYISEYLYYTFIEPKLNKKLLNVAYTDKGSYQQFIQADKLIKNLIKSVNGVIYKDDSVCINQEIKENGVVFKPSIESGGGLGIKFAFNKEEYDEFWRLFKKKYDNFVVQPIVKQNLFFSQFNETSLNTIRCLVYKSPISNRCIVINSVLRVGKKDSRVDNQAAGGRVIGIKDGVLGKFSIDKYGNKSNYINDIDLASNNFKINKWEEIESSAEVSVKNFPHAMIFGVDLCVLNDESVKVIEVNCFNNEINFYQMTNGPLFGDYTEEILRMANNRKTGYVLWGECEN